MHMYIIIKEILPTGFTIYRKDRSTRGGGVLLAIRQHIPSILLPSPDDLELLLIQVNSKTSFRVCLVYNPPNSDTNYRENLITFLQSIAADVSPLIIMGDFNSPDIDWPTLSGNTCF